MQWDNNNTINFVWKLVNSRTASVLLFLFNFIVICKRTFDVSLFYTISYLFINKSVHMLYIYSHF